MPSATRSDRRRPLARRLARWLLRVPPPLVLALLYAVLIAMGAALFKLPLSHDLPLSWSDAIFTAASAVTVTGLSVVDTGATFTIFGETVLMVLIQLGGLGLMTFAVLVLAALKLPIGLAGHIYLREDLGQNSLHRIMHLVRRIFQVVLICEAAGTLLLSITFIPKLGFWQGLWAALFHSVSAFNNAGFSTLPQGLMLFATDPILNLVIPALFIIGGIGYVVLDDVFRVRHWHRFTLHSKIMLVGTGALALWGWGVFAGLEWSNPVTLGQYPDIGDKLMVAWFQGLTPRTAGFATVDMSGMHDDTSLMIVSLMLIGGGPTSTAGGIKVTTFVVMCLATVAFFQRRTQLNAFGRSIGVEEVFRVMALVAISVIVVFVGVFLLSATHEGHFLDVVFEVASAFGTTGLSRGFTDDLNTFGRTIIVAIMFIGRVGPLTLGYFLATRSAPRVRYPAGKIYLG